MLRHDLCEHSDAHIVVKERIHAKDTNDANKINKKLIFKNNASYQNQKSKIKIQ